MAERTRADSPTKVCTRTGCDRPLRARGLCVTHYNQQDPARHPRETVPCVVCGTTVTRYVGSPYRVTCSVACRTVTQCGHASDSDGYLWQKNAVRRAKLAGVRIVEVFDRLDIFERDAWTCYLCGITCTDPDPYVHTAATVDHVVPLARGGEHSPRANAATCCLSCNARKQAA